MNGTGTADFIWAIFQQKLMIGFRRWAAADSHDSSEGNHQLYKCCLRGRKFVLFIPPVKAPLGGNGKIGVRAIERTDV